MLGPNITGAVYFDRGFISSASGAFSKTSYTVRETGTNASSNGGLSFDASLANAIYSSSETVQPTSNQTLIIIKT